MPIKDLQPGVLVSGKGWKGDWQGVFKTWIEYGEDRSYYVVKKSSDSYEELGKISFEGLKKEDKRDENPYVEVSGAQFNCRWVFTRLPDEYQNTNDFEFGWVQNVVRDGIIMSQ